MHRLVYTVVWTSVLFSHTAIGQGGPCTGAPAMCTPTGHMASAKTCITPANNGSGLSWYQMEDMCKLKDGRLVWLRNDYAIENMLYYKYAIHGSLVVTGLLSSTTDNAGLFWRNVNDTSFMCGTSDTTKACLSSNSTPDECSALGCCWRNGKCQYPHDQNLPTFHVNETLSNISQSTTRQCVGFQMNANSSHTGQWVSYDCFTPVSNAQYACEYKCNVIDWPAVNITRFVLQDQTTQTTMQTSPTAFNVTTEATTTVNTTTTPGCPTPNVQTTPGPNNSNQVSTTGTSKGNLLKETDHAFLKLLLSLENLGAATNMTFSLQQNLP